MLGALLGLVLMERDFGSSIVIAATALILLALAGARKRHLLLIIVGFGASGIALVGLVAYRADRLAHFLNPCAAALGSGFQNCQALYAFGSGGIFGVGIGATRCRSTSGSRRPTPTSSSRSSARNWA